MTIAMASLRSTLKAMTGLRLPMLLALLALFSLTLLGSWHDMHPDVGTTAHAVSVERSLPAVTATSDATGHPDYLDHVASHAGLHAIGLPASSTTAAMRPRPTLRWQSAAHILLTSIDPARTLRPPRG